MSELTEAAERLRRCADYGGDEELSSVYSHRQGHQSSELLQACDEAVVVEAYLAEHVLDDDEAITEQWLLSQGYRLLEFRDYLLSECKNGASAVVRLDQSGVAIGVFLSNYWIKMKSRGQLRKLLAALKAESE